MNDWDDAAVSKEKEIKYIRLREQVNLLLEMMRAHPIICEEINRSQIMKSQISLVKKHL